MQALMLATMRRATWGKLDGMHIEDVWALVGDFNCVLRPEERSLISGASTSFVEWVDRRGLLDM